MKQSLFHLIIRIFLKILFSTALLAKGIGFFIGNAGRTLRGPLRFGLPLVLGLYLLFRKIKGRIMRAVRPLRGHAFYVFGHRYFIQALVLVIVILVSAPSLRAADVWGSSSSDQLPLRELVPDEEHDFVVDDTLPTEELESYLEAFFQDQPTAKDDFSLPLALEGGALLNQDVPGTQMPLTRTEIVVYEVEPGDTPWDIAERFGLSVSTVLWENNLTLWSTIRPEQQLTILPVSGISHTVRKGEMLETVAKRYGVAVDEIEKYNKLADASALAVGFKLVIPGGRPYRSVEFGQPRRREVVAPPSIAATPGGKLLWPVQSKRITQYFKWRHTGLDVGDQRGNPIYASENGVVETAGWGRGGWGYTVVVNHGNGLKTRYAHASKVLVEAGQEVAKGQVIALVGSTGRSTGPHIHFGVYVNGRAVNPLQYLR